MGVGGKLKHGAVDDAVIGECIRLNAGQCPRGYVAAYRDGDASWIGGLQVNLCGRSDSAGNGQWRRVTQRKSVALSGDCEVAQAGDDVGRAQRNGSTRGAG